MKRIAHPPTSVQWAGVMRMRMGVQKRWLARGTEIPPATATGDGRTVLERPLNAPPKNIWTKDEISSIYNAPLMELTYAAVLPPFLHIWTNPSLTYRIANPGNATSKIPPPQHCPNLYPLIHQNRRMYRRLQLLRPILTLLHRPNGNKALHSRNCHGGRSRS